MFPRTFAKCHSRDILHHEAIHFISGLPDSEVIKRILDEGIVKFFTHDVDKPTFDNPYKDNRVMGVASYPANYGCCAFTKTLDRWYLFPIHKTDLENVGLCEEDLIKWIKFLNDTKTIFKYKYFGIHPTLPEHFNRINSYKKWAVENEFYWVGVPPISDWKNQPYLNWICLRYLINTNMGNGGGSYAQPYYMIPRVVMMLHEDFGLSRVKALMYAHISATYYYYYSMCYSDNMNNALYKPDVNLTSIQFRKLMSVTGINAEMNSVFSVRNAQSGNVKAIKDLKAPYDYMECFKLFQNGNYEGFVKHIKNAYKSLKTKDKKEISKKCQDPSPW